MIEKISIKQVSIKLIYSYLFENLSDLIKLLNLVYELYKTFKYIYLLCMFADKF